jgi:hypothetical protein
MIKSLRPRIRRPQALLGLRRPIGAANCTRGSKRSADQTKVEPLDQFERAGEVQLGFGIILDTPRFTCWEADCVSRLVQSRMCRLQVIVVAPRSNEHLLARLLHVVRYSLWTVYAVRGACLQTNKLLSRNPFPEVEIIHWSEENSGILADRLKKLGDYRLDFLLDFVSLQPDERLSAIPRYGVWRFTYGDDGSEDSQPSAFREVVLGAPVIRVSLRQFSDGKQAAAADLRSGFFAVEPCSYAGTLDRARLASADFPVLACKDLINGRVWERRSRSLTKQRSRFGTPGNWVMLRLALRSAYGKILSLFRRAFTQAVWNSGFIDISDLDAAKSRTASRVRWLQVRRNSVAADPFLVRWQNQLILLTENIHKFNNRGFIEAWRIQDEKATPLGKVIDEAVHLSYPYILEWQGSIYCIPEQARAHAIVLYRAVNFPMTWERIGEMLSGVDAIDPTLFRYGSFWWLAYTDASIDRHGRMMLWYSSELLGPWMPHALNPVKIDPRSSRGAGPVFLYDGHLVRPAQDCSGEYGARIVFNRINRLTPTEFHEDVIGELKPDPNGPYPAGLHTICRDGDIAVVDGKAYLIDPTAWLRKSARKFRRRVRVRKYS